MAKLSEKATRILRLIADGCSYNQIVARHPGTTSEDIFNAAAEALNIIERAQSPSAPDVSPRAGAASPEPISAFNDVSTTASQTKATSDYHERLAQIKRKHAKAYERWTSEEDAELTRMVRAHVSVQTMANTFQRQPSAIQSRLTKLGLIAAEESSDIER